MNKYSLKTIIPNKRLINAFNHTCMLLLFVFYFHLEFAIFISAEMSLGEEYSAVNVLRLQKYLSKDKYEEKSTDSKSQ